MTGLAPVLNINIGGFVACRDCKLRRGVAGRGRRVRGDVGSKWIDAVTRSRSATRSHDVGAWWKPVNSINTSIVGRCLTTGRVTYGLSFRVANQISTYRN